MLERANRNVAMAIVDRHGLKLASFDAACDMTDEERGGVEVRFVHSPSLVSYHFFSAQVLDLSSNFVQAFRHDVFWPLSKAPLTSLFLGANDLTVLPDLSALKHLRVLHLNNNKLTQLGTSLQGLGDLRVLNLRSNNLSVLEEDTFAGTARLERLSLSNNALVDAALAPRPFANLKQLTFLGLFGNRLSNADVLVNAIAGLDALDELIICANPIAADLSILRPQIVAILPRLRWLDWVLLVECLEA